MIRQLVSVTTRQTHPQHALPSSLFSQGPHASAQQVLRGNHADQSVPVLRKDYRHARKLLLGHAIGNHTQRLIGVSDGRRTLSNAADGRVPAARSFEHLLHVLARDYLGRFPLQVYCRIRMLAARRVVRSEPAGKFGRGHACGGARHQRRFAFRASQMKELRDQGANCPAGHDNRSLRAERTTGPDRDSRGKWLQKREPRLHTASGKEDGFDRLRNAVAANAFGPVARHPADRRAPPIGNSTA